MTLRGPTRPLSVAPMIDHTDRHFRYILRLLSKHVLLYTEMIVDKAIHHGDRERLLGYDPLEHPVALQLGGDDPVLMSECAHIAEDLGYDEVNINVGCPSDRVQSGCFGAVLMKTPERVAEMVAAMRARIGIPVTVKHRIGVDDLSRYEDLLNFVDIVSSAGADRFVVHARIALLAGLSPRQNREIPPLRHADVLRLKAERKALRVEINGGIRTLGEVMALLPSVDGVMVGRAVLDEPMMLAHADAVVYGDTRAPLSREDLVEQVADYIERCRDLPGFRSRYVLRHLVGLYTGVPGAKQWRKTLSSQADGGSVALRAALAATAG